MIADLTLAFSTIITEKSVLAILQEATKDGKLGEFSVNASSIVGTRSFIDDTTTTPSKTTSRVTQGTFPLSTLNRLLMLLDHRFKPKQQDQSVIYEVAT